MDVDFSELYELAADLEEAPKNLPKHLRKAFHVTSGKVKAEARKRVSGRSMMKQAAVAIDYDLDGFSVGSPLMVSEIGYNKGIGAGPLGNLIEFGAPKAREVVLARTKAGLKWLPKRGSPLKPLAPGGELQEALHANEGDFVTGIERAVADAHGEVGL